MTCRGGLPGKGVVRPAPRMSLGRVLRAVRLASGVLLIVLGIVGLFLPILQGILFIVLGLALLGLDLRRLRRLRTYLAERVRRFSSRDK